MPEWTLVPLDYERWSGGTSDVFAGSTTPFTADLLKTTPASSRARQAHFEETVRRLAWHLGSSTIPVFVDFNGNRRRMDKGCVGHAVASGFLKRPVNGPADYVTHVELSEAAAGIPQNG